MEPNELEAPVAHVEYSPPVYTSDDAGIMQALRDNELGASVLTMVRNLKAGTPHDEDMQKVLNVSFPGWELAHFEKLEALYRERHDKRGRRIGLAAQLQKLAHLYDAASEQEFDAAVRAYVENLG